MKKHAVNRSFSISAGLAFNCRCRRLSTQARILPGRALRKNNLMPAPLKRDPWLGCAGRRDDQALINLLSTT
jgi:hypothetical protein